jgi:hypothetical protein
MNPGNLIQLTDDLKSLYIKTAQKLKGSDRRQFMAEVVKGFGIGGQTLAERELGWNRRTIRKGMQELLSGQVPNARVVKAFNTMAQELFELAPAPLNDYNVSVFVAGDDESAKQTVMELTQSIGFKPIDCGGLRHARLIESAGDLIRLLMIQQQMGAYATISVHSLPPAQTQRLGGRQASNLK